MRAQTLFRALLLSGAAFLAACSGDNTISGETDSDDGGGETPTVTPAAIILSSSSDQLPADADTQSEGVTLAAIVLDSGGRTIEGATVTFSLSPARSGALVVTQGTTDSSGVAQAVVHTGGISTFPRTITVTAIAGSVNDSVSIDVVDPNAPQTPVSVSALALFADASALFADADTQAEGVTLTAVVTDSRGNIVSGVPVTFSLSLLSGTGPAGSIQVTRNTTDASGTATAVLTTSGNTAARTIRVTASATDGSNTFTDTEDFDVVGHATRITGFLSSTVLFADDGVPVTITARATDSIGDIVANVPVTFTVSSGALSGGTSNGPRSVTVVTDSTGETSGTPVTLTTGGDPTLRTITITPSAPGVTSITTGSVQVIRAVSRVDASVSASRLFGDADQASEGVVVSARVTASDGSVLANVPIGFSVTNSTSGRNGALQTANATTDATGTATTVLTVGTALPGDALTVTATFDRTTAADSVSSVTVPVIARVASVTLLASAPQLPSSADTFAEGVTFTALVKDGNNNLVSGIDVAFSSDLGALQVTGGTTGTDGTATTVLHTGGNPRNQNITVTATAQSQSATLAIPVTGTALRISGPTVIGSGDTETFTVTLVDAANAGIPNQTVTLTSATLGNPLNGSAGPISLTTDTQGQVTVTYTGNTGGTDTFQASAVGVTKQQSIAVSQFKLVFNTPASGAEVPFRTAFDPAPDPTVDDVTVTLTQNGSPVSGATIQFGTTRGALSAATATTNASGQATVNIRADGAGAAGGAVVSATDLGSEVSTSRSIEFTATTPARVTLRVEPAVIAINGTSAITAVVRDADENLVKNQRVNFFLSDSTGGSLSAAFGETDSLGTTSVTYAATETPSSTSGVSVTATVNGTAIQDTATLTVGNQALRIILGTGNEMADPTTTTYAMPWVVLVTDAAGNPPPTSTVFSVSIEPVAYQKGFYFFNGDFHEPNYTVTGADVQSSGLSPKPRDFGCINEDINRDGIRQTGEDFNGNQNLDPGGVASVPSRPTLNPDGTAFFDVTYGQIYGNWVMMRLKATASVEGTESLSYVDFVLPVLASDVNDENSAPPGITRGQSVGSPYGEATTCADPD